MKKGGLLITAYIPRYFVFQYIATSNEKYLDELDGRLQVLNELRKRIIELSKAIIGDTLYKEDFFFTSAMDRSVVLLDGISEMIKNRNLACGGILYVRR